LRGGGGMGNLQVAGFVGAAIDGGGFVSGYGPTTGAVRVVGRGTRRRGRRVPTPGAYRGTSM
ncbi:hypothetical protein, partial [Micromonospora inaquosa]|uniref:hypothetical protein n=1 Tax=Micromonospora inaquosa TaxID=2203716 RepID=UPI001ABF8203